MTNAATEQGISRKTGGLTFTVGHDVIVALVYLKQMNEWKNKWMKEWKNEEMKEGMKKWMNEWRNEGMKE